MTSVAIGGVGDSITFGQYTTVGSFERLILALNAANNGNTYSGVNRGIPGFSTLDWAPGTSTLNDAKAAFAAAGVTVVTLMLGANDSNTGHRYSPGTFRTQLAAIVNDLVSSGYRVILNEPTYTVPGSIGNVYDATAASLAFRYAAEMDALVNGSTILRGDRSGYAFFQAHTDQLVDGVHPNDTGAVSLGGLWATAALAVLAPANATALTLSGPSVGRAGSASTAFTVTAIGGPLASSVIVTPTSDMPGGFAPSTVMLSPSNLSGTFTFSPVGAGTDAISLGNDGGLSNPLAASYVALTAPAVTTIFDLPIEGGFSSGQLLSALTAIFVGRCAGQEGGNPTFQNVAGTRNCVVASLDASRNRVSVSLNV